MTALSDPIARLTTKAICSEFPRGIYWSTDNPYYCGHFRTKREAIRAALKAREAAR